MLKSTEAEPENITRLGLTHRVYLPAEAASGKRPIVFMIHGRAGDATLMWTFSKVFPEPRPIVIALQGFLPDPIGGWSWWLVDKLPDGSPRVERKTTIADLQHAHARVEPFIDGAIDLYGGDPKRVYAMGFSQGAAVASTLSLKRPELFSGVALLAGFIPSVVFREEGIVAPAVKNKTAKLPHYFFGHGSKDQVIALPMAENAAAELRGFGAEVEFFTDDVGHKVGIESLRELKTWFATELAG